MTNGYFHHVAAQTTTRLWVNNPTLAEAEQAVRDGAISCTSNPTYSAGLISKEPAVAQAAIADAVARHPSDPAAAAAVQRALCARVMPAFAPLRGRDGRGGFVSVQSDPFLEDDPAHIIEEALLGLRLGPGFIAKIPATAAGFAAISELIGHNVPILVTEIFAINQAIESCRVYAAASAKTGKKPLYVLTHISGIFDEYLAEQAKQRGITVSPEAMQVAGLSVARAQVAALRAAGYQHVVLGGGARGPHHFTGVVGGMDITINPSTARELLASPPPVANRIAEPTPSALTAELRKTFPDYIKAIDPAGLPVAAFADYGPVRHFRGIFEKGWTTLMAAVKAERSKRPVAAKG